MAFGDSSPWLAGRNSTSVRPRGPLQTQAGWSDASGGNIADPVYSDPQYNYLYDQASRIGFRGGVEGGYNDSQRAGQLADYNTSLRGIDLQAKGYGVDRGAVARDQAYIDAMKAQAGLERKNQGDINNNNLATGVRGINSEATAGGSWFGPGRNDQISDAYKNWGTTNTSADIAYQRDILGLDKQRGEAADRNAKLDIMGQQLGIDRDKLKNNLTQGLNTLGYNRYITFDKLIDDLNSNDVAVQQRAQQLVQQAYAAGDTYHTGALGDQYDAYNRGSRRKVM